MTNVSTDKVTDIAYFDNAGDVEAFDELPKIWRHRLSVCPILFSAKATLHMIKNYSEDFVLEQYIDIIFKSTGVTLDSGGLPPNKK